MRDCPSCFNQRSLEGLSGETACPACAPKPAAAVDAEAGILAARRAICPHEYWSSDTGETLCEECGIVCEHETWKRGQCVQCGVDCEHSDVCEDDRVCLICGADRTEDMAAAAYDRWKDSRYE